MWLLISHLVWYWQLLMKYVSICCQIMSFDPRYTVKLIASMKTWGKSSCALRMKERIEIIDYSQCRYSQIINTCSEVYKACRHIPVFHRFIHHWWSSDRRKSHEIRIFQIWIKRKTVPSWSSKIWKRRISQPLGGFLV